MNRLAYESSPYLLQHAGNPVDWYPWSDEAFEKARIEDKPVFLSVGYSTCHWCHVMAHESFEDSDVAGMMNMAFVNIKVDREERPDIDSIYMKVCQAMTGSGGWPLSIIMTPDKKPFFAGTYFPKTSMYGRIGMKDLILRIDHSWKHDREKIMDSAEKVVSWLNEDTVSACSNAPGISTLEQAFRELSAAYDPLNGGFTGAPKFPTPQNLTFLLRHYKRSGDQKALQMVEKTLDIMRYGGIYDHVGFGFHRYSTDAEWFLPHFEKMLYDQAMISMAYTEAFQATGKPRYEKTAREIFSYVSRDLKSNNGAFFSAEDADSEGIEGAFYLWTDEQIRGILGKDEAVAFIRSYGVRLEGNFHEEAARTQGAGNILHLVKPLSELAYELGMTEGNLRETLDQSCKKLLPVREKRIRPHLYDKIMTDWNGLMIASLAKASRAFDDGECLLAASAAADFFLAEMLNPDGSLLHSFRGKPSLVPGFLNDYAYMVWGLIELYQAGFDIKYLKAAIKLSEYMTEHFEDKASGGFFLSSDMHEEILVRVKDFYDGALPSGNSVAANNLIRLGRITANPVLEEKARKVFMAFGAQLEYRPSAYAQLISLIDFEVGPSFEVVIAGSAENEDTKEIVRALNSKFLPNMTVLLANQDEPSNSFLTSIAPYVKDMKVINGHATVYVCSGRTCQEPVTDIHRLKALLD